MDRPSVCGVGGSAVSDAALDVAEDYAASEASSRSAASLLSAWPSS